MEASIEQACKFILTTWDDGTNNKFYDSTFRLRPPFKPNGNHQYRVCINECLFKNDEPTLMKGVDWFEFIIYYNDNTPTTHARVNVDKDLYTFSDQTDGLVIDILTLKAGNGYVTKPASVNQVKLYDGENEYATSGSRYIGANATMEVYFNNPNNVKAASIRYSTNYGYLLNNLRESEYKGEEGVRDGNKVFRFPFYNLSRGGPVAYILKTPLKATVPTYNARNQAYNIVAAVRNSASFHNTIIEMPSSMEIVTSDLSNLRLELVNDQYEHVNIRGPLYIQITVSNGG